MWKFTQIVMLMAAIGANGGATESDNLPCVHDQCPLIYISGAGLSAVNGLYTPYRDCSNANYGNNKTDAIWDGYINKNGAYITWYFSPDAKTNMNGWGVGYDGHARYYDGLHRTWAVTDFLGDNWVARGGSYASPPNPIVTCLSPATVQWQVQNNPTAQWSATASSSFSTQDQQTTVMQASIGASFKSEDGISSSASEKYSRTVQDTVGLFFTNTQSETCSNPCGSNHLMWVQTVTTTLTDGDIQTILPQCGLITCTAYGQSPKCPSEYCGGNSIFDGCQCCTSLEWVGSVFTGPLPPICGL